MFKKLALFLIAASLLPAVSRADSLPLTLKLSSPKEPQTLTCTGKSWIEVSAGTMQRETLLAVLPGPDPLSNEQKLLACDDGTGKDAPVTGAVSEVRRFLPGQSVIEGTLRVIVLAYPAPPNTLSSIIFAVNSALGEDALLSKSGKGLIRVDRDNGIAVYPPSYELRRVFEDRIYTVVDPRKTAAAPCTITYLAENPSAPPQKVLHSHLDCTTLIQQTSSDAIFGGNVPQ